MIIVIRNDKILSSVLYIPEYFSPWRQRYPIGSVCLFVCLLASTAFKIWCCLMSCENYANVTSNVHFFHTYLWLLILFSFTFLLSGINFITTGYFNSKIPCLYALKYFWAISFVCFVFVFFFAQLLHYSFIFSKINSLRVWKIRYRFYAKIPLYVASNILCNHT